MTLGTGDKKKVWFLAALGLLACYMVYANLLSGPSAAPAPVQTQPAAARVDVAVPAPADTAQAPNIRRASVSQRGPAGDFHPVLRSKRPEDRIDPMGVDPTLRLDLLAKVQEQQPAGGTRNLFQFSAAPPPKPVALPKGPEPKVLPQAAAMHPPVAPPRTVDPPVPPPPYKYYGYSMEPDNGRKKAFFLDGDDIVVAAEGDMLNKRYRLVRIGPSSAVVEDTQSKRQQPVPLAQEAGG